MELMNQDVEFEGGCTCGALRYRVRSEPMFTHCCHCRWCQRETGTAFALNALIETDRITTTSGETEETVLPTASGGGQTLVRCPSCKVVTWSHYGKARQLAFLRVGTLDEPDAMPPNIHIWTQSKQPWVVLPEGADVVEEYYKAADHWPVASLERRKALFS